MARCPSCNMFCSQEIEVEETDSLQVGETHLKGAVRLVLLSECCGDEVKQCYVDVEEELPEEALANEEAQWEVEVEAEGTDRYQSHDRHGKPIKNMQYARHYWGANIEATLTDTVSGDELELSFTVEEQASSFEELC